MPDKIGSSIWTTMELELSTRVGSTIHNKFMGALQFEAFVRIQEKLTDLIWNKVGSLIRVNMENRHVG